MISQGSGPLLRFARTVGVPSVSGYLVIEDEDGVQRSDDEDALEECQCGLDTCLRCNPGGFGGELAETLEPPGAHVVEGGDCVDEGALALLEAEWRLEAHHRKCSRCNNHPLDWLQQIRDNTCGRCSGYLQTIIDLNCCGELTDAWAIELAGRQPPETCEHPEFIALAALFPDTLEKQGIALALDVMLRQGVPLALLMGHAVHVVVRYFTCASRVAPREHVRLWLEAHGCGEGYLAAQRLDWDAVSWLEAVGHPAPGTQGATHAVPEEDARAG